jgi:type I restriction enzyme S subunit
MACEWRETTLGKFVSLQRGHDLTDAERRRGTVPVIGAAGQNGFHDTPLARGPGIVVGRSGASFGQVYYCETDYWPHNTGLYVTDFLGNDPRFAFYFLKALDFSRYNSGSAQPSLNRNFIYPIEVQVPPLDEQRAIAHILGTLDDKIELNRRMNETLEAMARALFKSWFVDFDPVRAKAEGRDPGLPQPLADLFPARLVDSELGEIPEGWEVGSVETLCESITSGGTPARMNPHFWEGGTIPWFKTGELLDGPLVESEEHITQAALDGSSCKLWPAGTILFALYASPTVGRLGVLTCPGTSNQAAAGLIAKSTIGVPFLRRLLLDARVKLQTIAVGAAQQNINQAVLKAHRAVIPPEKTASSYSRLVAAADDRQVTLSKEANALATLRDSLLPTLISGELRINRAQQLSPEAPR